jgi:hypothetical protein
VRIEPTRLVVLSKDKLLAIATLTSRHRSTAVRREVGRRAVARDDNRR